MHATVYSASAFKKGLAISCMPSVGMTMDTTLQRELWRKKSGSGDSTAAAPALAHDQAQVPRFVGEDSGVGRVPDVGDALHIAAVDAAMASSAVARAAVTHAAVVIVKSHHRRRHGTSFTSNTPRSFR